MKETTDETRVLLAIIVSLAIGFAVGMGAVGGCESKWAPTRQAEACAPCPQNIQMQCVHDNWNELYIAGKCGKK